MEKDLNFKPMSDGLGFHPFSDGLPYAPVSRASRATRAPDAETATARARALLAQGPAYPAPATHAPAPQIARVPTAHQASAAGTGATAAGPARFARELPTLGRAAAGTGTTSAAAQAVLRARATAQAGTQAAPFGSIGLPAYGPRAANPQYAPVPYRAPAESYGFGYLFRRALAFGIDSVVNISVCGLALGFVARKQGIGFEAIVNPSVAILGGAFLLAFSWALITAQEVALKTTLGKRMLGLELRGAAVPIFLRAFFFLPSLGFCGIGVLWGIFDSRRRCWHDHVVDLQPERIS